MMRRPVVALLTGLFAASVVFSLGGMLALAVAPQIGARIGPMLHVLMRAPTWVYVTTLPLAVFAAFLPSLGWRRSALLAGWGTLVGAAAELVGTGTGFPFGAYAYTDFLGPKILGRVPWTIPPSWYAASLLAFVLASRAGAAGTRRVVLAAFFLVCWDVALDPAMSAGFPVWQWETAGIFYGMPVVNWLGWFATGLLIMGGFELVAVGGEPEARRWPELLWLLNGAFAVGICALGGLWAAVVLGATAILVPFAWRRFAAVRVARAVPREA